MTSDKGIYAKGEWPKDFAESIIFPIEKKKGAQNLWISAP